MSIRFDLENSVTFAVTEEKGDVTLLRWIQAGVEYSTQKMQLSMKKSDTLSLHVIDDSGDCMLVNYNNTRLECVEVASSKVNWRWNLSTKTTNISTFDAKQLVETKNADGFVLLVLSEQAQFYSVSATNPPTEPILSRSWSDVLPFHESN